MTYWIELFCACILTGMLCNAFAIYFGLRCIAGAILKKGYNGR